MKNLKKENKKKPFLELWRALGIGAEVQGTFRILLWDQLLPL